VTRSACGIVLAALALFGPASHAAQPQAGYSAAEFYNSANSYARAGKPGLAVLNYERARLLEPDDADIEANLRRVREMAGLAPEARNVFARVFARMSGLAGPLLLPWLGVLGLGLAGGGVLARRIYPGHRRTLLAAALLGICLLGVAIAHGVALWPIMHEAVVVTPTAPVRDSPVPMGDPSFVLREAEIVKTGARHDGFVLVQSRAGRQGWVSSGNLAPIVPKPGDHSGNSG
jgi:hypothetical protein